MESAWDIILQATAVTTIKIQIIVQKEHIFSSLIGTSNSKFHLEFKILDSYLILKQDIYSNGNFNFNKREIKLSDRML